MASISRDPGGKKRIQFIDANGDRKAVRLGKVSQRAAEAVKFRVEQLLAARLTGHAIEADTAGWVAALEPAMAKKLARVGLISSRTTLPATTLGPFLTLHFDSRVNVKPATKVVWGQTRRNLMEFFGESRNVQTITPVMQTASRNGWSAKNLPRAL